MKRLLWTLPVVAGVGMVAVAVLLSSSSVRSPGVSSVSAQTACDLSITKEVDNSTVAAGDNADYTITVTNDGSSNCVGFTVTDVIPNHMTCASADVSSNSNITSVDVSSCRSSTTEVTWDSPKTLTKNDGNEAILTLSLTTDDTLADGRTITNEACVVSDSETSGATPTPVSVCDHVKITIGTAATATPTATFTPIATSTPYVLVVPTPYVPPPAPTAAKKPVVVPSTGTGAGSSGGSPWLAIGLGLGGACLLVVSGAALARKRIR